MEAGTAPRQTTASRTIADLLPKAAQLYGGKVAQKRKVAGEWRDVSFTEVWAAAREIALGLIDLGIEPGDRVCLLANTRVEWTWVDFAITTTGAVVVPIYPTNSPEECEWVLGNSDAVAVVCEDAGQLEKVFQVRERLPELRHVITMTDGAAITLDELRERGRARDAAELEARYEAVTPDDPYTFIYTSGTTGPPKGCVLTHGNYRSILDSVNERELFRGEDDLVYLFLPLAHAFALLIQLGGTDNGTTIAYFGGDTRRVVEEIVEFFWAAGVPVLEGYGMTETATAATTSRPEAHKFGTVGKALSGVELKVAEDGELLVKGKNIFAGYYKNSDASFGAVVDGWLHTGDLATIDEDGYVSIVGRKKDIIITAGGKNLTPANFENDLKQTRWVSQCVMHGDRRPYPVALITLDEEEIVPWAREHGIEDVSTTALANDPHVRDLIQREVDKANAKYAQVEQVKKFVILDHDLSQETGELTPTLKVKRNVVNERYAPLFDELYG